MGLVAEKRGRKIAAGAVSITIGVILLICYLIMPIAGLEKLEQRPYPSSIGVMSPVEATYASINDGLSVYGNTTLVSFVTSDYIGFAVNKGVKWDIQQTSRPGVSPMAVSLINGSQAYVLVTSETSTTVKIQLFTSSDGGITWSSSSVSEMQGRGEDIIRLFKTGRLYIYLGGVGLAAGQNSLYRLWRWTVDGTAYTGPDFLLKLYGNFLEGEMVTGGEALSFIEYGGAFYTLIHATTGSGFRTNHYLLFGYSGDGLSFDLSTIPGTSLAGFSTSSPGCPSLAVSGSKVVFTAVQDGVVYWLESSDKVNWTPYKYTATSKDWLRFNPALASFGGQVYAFWLRDGGEGKPVLVRWNGAVGEPEEVVSFTTPVVSRQDVVQAVSANNKVYLLVGEGYRAVGDSFSDLRVVSYPVEEEVTWIGIKLPHPEWLPWVAAVFIIIGVLVMTPSGRGKEKKKKSARA